MTTDPHDTTPDTTPAQLAGVVRIGKRSYAASLIWNTAADQKTLIAEARESAVRLGASVMCLYRIGADTLPQYGLGDALIDHRPGLPALAAAVGAASGGSLYGVWHSDDGAWVLLGIRADASVAYDKAFEKEAQARIEFYEGLATEPWTEIVCPEAWQVDGAGPSGSLSERFTTAKVKLRPVRRNLPRLIFFALLVAATLGAAGYLYKQVHKAPPPLPKLPQAVHIPPMPWVDQPQPAATLQACVGALWGGSAAAGQIPGWAADANGRCDGHTVSYGISLQGGTVNWLKPYVSQVPGAPVLSNQQGTRATLTWTLPPLPSYPAGSPGILINKAEAYLRSNFAELQLPLTITPGQSMPFWRSFRYQFSTEVSPDTFIPLLGKIPGSVIREVTFNSSSNKWSVTGEVFEHLIPRPGSVK